MLRAWSILALSRSRQWPIIFQTNVMKCWDYGATNDYFDVKHHYESDCCVAIESADQHSHIVGLLVLWTLWLNVMLQCWLFNVNLVGESNVFILATVQYVADVVHYVFNFLPTLLGLLLLGGFGYTVYNWSQFSMFGLATGRASGLVLIESVVECCWCN